MRTLFCLIAFLCWALPGRACQEHILRPKCVKNYSYPIICNGQLVTNDVIVIDFTLDCNDADADVWIKFPQSLINPNIPPNAYHLQFLYATPTGGGSVINLGHYQLVINKYNVTGSGCTKSPDYPYFAAYMLNAEGDVDCGALHGIKPYYTLYGSPAPTSFPAQVPYGLSCCDTDIPLEEEPVVAACYEQFHGKNMIKMTVTENFNFYFPDIPPATTLGTAYLYISAGGPFNTTGIAPVQINGSGNTYNYYYPLPQWFQEGGCVSFFWLPTPTSFNQNPGKIYTACRCCNSNFSYTAYTNSLNVDFQANSLWYSPYKWTFGDGTDASTPGPSTSHLYPSGGSYKAFLLVGASGSKDPLDACKTSLDICLPAEIIPQPGDACNANFSYTVNSTDPYTVHFSALNTTQIGPFTWVFGDGSFINNGLSTTASHTYTSTGTFEVCLARGTPAPPGGTGSFFCEKCTNICITREREGDGGHYRMTSSMAEGGDLVISPNPVYDQLQLTYTSKADQTGILTLTDLTGRIVHKNAHALISGTNAITISAGTLPPGMYILQLRVANETYTQKILKQ